MNISQKLDQAAGRLNTIDWEKVTKDVIKIWDLFFKVLVILMILTYIAGKSLGTWVHQTNDWLAHQWVRLIVPPTSVEGQALITVVTKKVSVPTPPTIVEVEPPLPPIPLMIEDPWESPIEVELMLPLEPIAILFTSPLLLAVAQAPVALLTAGQEVPQQTPPLAPVVVQKPIRKEPVRQAPPPETNNRRKKEKPAPTQVTAKTPRGRRAHQNRTRQIV